MNSSRPESSSLNLCIQCLLDIIIMSKQVIYYSRKVHGYIDERCIGHTEEQKPQKDRECGRGRHYVPAATVEVRRQELEGRQGGRFT